MLFDPGPIPASAAAEAVVGRNASTSSSRARRRLYTWGVWWLIHQAHVRWAREEALPEIERLVQDGLATEGLRAWTAFELAARAEQYIPDDPLFGRLLPRFSRTERIFSIPAGADVFAKPYAEPASEWRYIGRTPIDSIRVPLGYSRVKLEKTGYRTAHDIIWNSSAVNDTLLYQLSEKAMVPEDMEAVPAYASWYRIVAAPAALHMPGRP